MERVGNEQGIREDESKRVNLNQDDPLRFAPISVALLKLNLIVVRRQFSMIDFAYSNSSLRSNFAMSDEIQAADEGGLTKYRSRWSLHV